MGTTGPTRLSVPRRLWAAWLLFLFVAGQGVPVFALAATDRMTGMACCMRGGDSCCRRKPMHTAPSLQAGHACGLACPGIPMVSFSGGPAIPLAPVSVVHIPAKGSSPAVLADRQRLPASVSLLRFQRPPPYQA